MIKLKNIKISDREVSCEIFPEDSREGGYIVVDTNSKKIINLSLPKDYEWCDNHVEHAITALLEIAKSKNPIKEKLLMWY